MQQPPYAPPGYPGGPAQPQKKSSNRTLIIVLVVVGGFLAAGVVLVGVLATLGICLYVGFSLAERHFTGWANRKSEIVTV